MIQSYTQTHELCDYTLLLSDWIVWMPPKQPTSHVHHQLGPVLNGLHIETYQYKVTICPDFFGTVLNFDDLYRENYEEFQDAELS